MCNDDVVDDDPFNYILKKTQQLENFKQLAAVVLTRSASSVTSNACFQQWSSFLMANDRDLARSLRMHCRSFMNHVNFFMK
jgi:hypothetical protein